MEPGLQDPDVFDLSRFIAAQEHTYADALSELRAGWKKTHWMWWVFPQFRGMGVSPTSVHYAIGSLAEARAYLQHPVLGPRLEECAAALLALPDTDAGKVMGAPDDMKLRSCATLFAHLSPPGSVFHQLLAKFFAGAPDPRTLAKLAEAG